MDINIRAIGRLKSTDPKAILIDDYLDRAAKTGRGLGFRSMAIESFETPRQLTGTAAAMREGIWLLSGMAETEFAIVLDEHGQQFDSITFAKMLEKQRDSASGPTIFLIGGADGHTDTVRARANLLLSFGKPTWPHMLARLMLCEQLYRAMTILSGHPYHRA